MSAIVKTTRLKTKRRPGDPWISKNRVLNGGNGKNKRNCPIYRNPNFDTDETKLLIQLWGDPKTQRELITTHKKHVVIAQLSAKMEEYGYYRSPEEITTRIKNMKCFYNRLKKEMEINNNMDPSWRHFAEMDTIMTRPIFSVRPNEVPAPSLKYLLEQEQEKRKERKRKAEEEGSTISDSDEDLTDILAVPNSASNTKDTTSNEATVTRTSTDIELEIDESITKSLENSTEVNNKSNEENQQNRTEQTMSDAEIAIKLEIESEQFQEYQSVEGTECTNNNDSNTKKTEEPIKTINISEDDDLLVPKIEPIDVDEEFVETDKTTTTTTTTPAPATANQSISQLTDILKQPSKVQNMPPPTMIKFSMPTNSTSVTISSANSFTPTQSKISVVSPTILMPTQQISTNKSTLTNTDQRQLRLPANLQALLAASGSRATVTNGNGMKFLLVNTPDQRGPPITTANISSAIPLSSSTNRNNIVTNQANVNIIKDTTQVQQQQQQQSHKPSQDKQQQQGQKTQLQYSQILKAKEAFKNRQEFREQLKKRDLAGIKSALVKMMKFQEHSNEIQAERLAIERERLLQEKTIADRFLNIVEQQQKIQQQMQQQLQQQQQFQFQQQQLFQLQQRPTTTQQMFTTNTGQATLTSNGQIMLPPKLLITTMVPNSSGQATTVPTPKVLTTAGFTNLTSSMNNDLQLVVPKEEPLN